MAELLIKAVDATHQDPEKDRRGTHKKGDVITVMPDAHPWGTREGPPRFVRIRCPEVTVGQVRDRMQDWRWRLRFEVVGSNVPQDSYRIRATNETQSVGGAGGLSLERVEAYLTRWGATVVSSTTDSVTFDVRIYDAATSEGFWGTLPDGLVFTEESYTRTGGVHRISADYLTVQGYLDKPVSFTRGVESRVQQRGGTDIVTVPGVTTFDIDRSTVREAFRADLDEKLGTYRRHRYYFHPDDVDLALGMGGVVDLTAAQVANRVLDRLAE